MMLKHILLLSIAVAGLGACSGVRETIGLSRSAPDEFKVVKRAPLEMPNAFTLPPPRPGAPRPQETAIPKVVENALLGTSQQPASLSDGERALLQQTEAAQAAPDIRSTVDAETETLSEEGQSVTQKLLGMGGLNKKSDVLDAKEEAKRLNSGTQE
jgi:hypothetical protein